MADDQEQDDIDNQDGPRFVEEDPYLAVANNQARYILYAS